MDQEQLSSIKDKAKQHQGKQDDSVQRQHIQTDYNEQVKAFVKGGSLTGIIWLTLQARYGAETQRDAARHMQKE